MNNSVKVSVIVPVFNVEAYLEQCIESIRKQSLVDIEIICGDGGSTDGSLNILKKLKDKDSRIIIYSKEKSGYGQTLNECIEMAKGEYIGIVESDDLIKPTMYEELYEEAQRNELDWIRGDVLCYYPTLPENKRFLYDNIITPDCYGIVLNPQQDPRAWRSNLRTWSGIYKKQFLEENKIMHNETPGGSFQDVGFFLRTMYYAKRVCFVNRPYYLWRQDRPGSSINLNSAKLIEKSIREWKLDHNYLCSADNLGAWQIAGFRYRQFLSYRWTLDMAIGEDRKKVQSVVKEDFDAALYYREINRTFFTDTEWADFISFLEKAGVQNINNLYDESQNEVVFSSKKSFKERIRRFIRTQLEETVCAYIKSENNKLVQLINNNDERLEQQKLLIQEGKELLDNTNNAVISLENRQIALQKQLEKLIDSISCIEESLENTAEQYSSIRVTGSEIAHKVDEVNSCVIAVSNALTTKSNIIHSEVNSIRRITSDVSDLISFWSLNKANNLKKEKKVFLIGTPEHSNVGDAAITVGTYEFVKKYFRDYRFFEIPLERFQTYHGFLSKIISNEDIIMLQGGGNLGSRYHVEENNRRMVLQDYKNINTIILPQTLWFEDDESGLYERRITELLYRKHAKLTVFTRGKESYQLAKTLFPAARCYLSVDMALMLSANMPHGACDKVLLCLRDTEDESALSEEMHKKIKSVIEDCGEQSDIIDNNYVGKVASELRESIVWKEIERYSQYRCVITDRLHGIILSMIAGTPCIAFKSADYKIPEFLDLVGTRTDVKYLGTEVRLLEECLKDMVKKPVSKNDGNRSFEEHFDRMAEIIKGGL